MPEKDEKTMVETMAETIKTMKDQLDTYEAERKAMEKVKEAERKANERFESEVLRAEKEAEYVNDMAERVFQQKMKEHRSKSKIVFPVTQRAGNLKTADKQLLDIIMQRKSPGVYGIKTLTTGGVGVGAELVPEELSSQLREDIDKLAVIRGISEVVNMPTNPFRYPLLTGEPTIAVYNETEAVKPSDPNTSELVLVAKKLAGRTDVSYEEGEDAIIAVLPAIRNRLVRAMVNAEEAAFIMGDKSSDDDLLKAFDGLLKLAGQTHSAGADGSVGAEESVEGKKATVADANAARAKMGLYGARANDLVWVMGLETYNEWLIHQPELMTVDKYGPNATILTGEVGRLFGVPVVCTSGFEPPKNGKTLKSQKALLVYRNAPLIGDRRGFTIKTNDDPVTEVVKVIGSERTTIALPFANTVVNTTIWF